ncbi:hypothetical protein [uncultured Gimesia sp.]|uniref:hypothetical protein n=1 Tax=uncultured Gimesia sp. TaxID=1678688 RepID=UPI00262D6E98|nr:hypothetical protein [uncultured Gimesia sp.]
MAKLRATRAASLVSLTFCANSGVLWLLLHDMMKAENVAHVQKQAMFGDRE